MNSLKNYHFIFNDFDDPKHSCFRCQNWFRVNVRVSGDRYCCFLKKGLVYKEINTAESTNKKCDNVKCLSTQVLRNHFTFKG